MVGHRLDERGDLVITAAEQADAHDLGHHQRGKHRCLGRMVSQSPRRCDERRRGGRRRPSRDRVLWVENFSHPGKILEGFNPFGGWEPIREPALLTLKKPAKRPFRQKSHPPIVVGGGFPQGARRAVAYGDGWMPIGGRGGDTLALLPPFRDMLKAAGRPESDVPVTLFGVAMDGEGLKRARDAGVDRAVFVVPPEARDKVLPLLDKGADVMRQV
jgi:luciferase-like monooxygenase